MSSFEYPKRWLTCLKHLLTIVVSVADPHQRDMPYHGMPSYSATAGPSGDPSMISSPGSYSSPSNDQSHHQSTSTSSTMTSHQHLQGNGSESFYPTFEATTSGLLNNNAMRIKRKRDPLDPNDHQPDWVQVDPNYSAVPSSSYSTSDPYYGMDGPETASWTTASGPYFPQALNQPHHHHRHDHHPPPYLHHEGLYAPQDNSVVSSLPPMSSFARPSSTPFPEVSSPAPTSEIKGIPPGIYATGPVEGYGPPSTPVSSPPGSWSRMAPTSNSVTSFSNVPVAESGHTLHPMVSLGPIFGMPFVLLPWFMMTCLCMCFPFVTTDHLHCFRYTLWLSHWITIP